VGGDQLDPTFKGCVLRVGTEGGREVLWVELKRGNCGEVGAAALLVVAVDLWVRIEQHGS
jgi:hypothetical protein